MPRRTGRGFVELDPFGIVSVADAISYPYANEIRTFLGKRTSKGDAPRISDIVNFVCYRCAVPLAFAWAWMCTDFPSSNLDMSNWRSITQSYIEENLVGLGFVEMKALSSSFFENGLRPSIRLAFKNQRRILGLSLNEMASRLGVDRKDVAALEHGCFPMSIPRCGTFNKAMVGYEIHPVRLLQLAFTSVADIYETSKQFGQF